jgi:hypothetical protein
MKKEKNKRWFDDWHTYCDEKYMEVELPNLQDRKIVLERNIPHEDVVFALFQLLDSALTELSKNEKK